MALDCTVGGLNANSYVCRPDADAYHADRVDAATWAAASTATRDAALVSATSRLEQESYTGSPTFVDQALQWPRHLTLDRDGFLFDSATIPACVRYACMELALALVKEPALLLENGLEGFAQVGIGPLSVTPRGIRAGALPAAVLRLLEPVRLGGTGSKVQRA